MVSKNGKNNPQHVEAYKEVEKKQKKDGTDEKGAKKANERIKDFYKEVDGK
jgi:hypothetical protein